MFYLVISSTNKVVKRSTKRETLVAHAANINKYGFEKPEMVITDVKPTTKPGFRFNGVLSYNDSVENYL